MQNVTVSTTTIRGQFDTLINELTTMRHPAVTIARKARNIAQAAAEGKAGEKHIDGLRALAHEVIALHNSSHLNGFRLFCRRLTNLINRLGERMKRTLTTQVATPTQDVVAPQVNVTPRNLLADATAAQATARTVAATFNAEAQAQMADLTGGTVF